MQGLTHVRDRTGLTRRHAAVLFVDLTGFTALVESVRPETVYRLVRPILDELVLLVDAYGGDIQQVLGDGFMAVFGLEGAPGPGAPGGDEVARAVQAGIALVCAGGAGSDLDVPGGLRVHAGVECGEVLVSPSWEPARFAVWGRAVTFAARLCDLAGPGTLHVGPQAFERGGRRILERWADGSQTVLRTGLKGIAGEVVVHGWHGAGEPDSRRPGPSSAGTGPVAGRRVPPGQLLVCQ